MGKGLCGTWYKFEYNSQKDKYGLAFKSTCLKHKIYSVWTVTADIASWTYARENPQFDLREDGDKRFTNIDNCKFKGDDKYQCDITIDIIDGVEQNTGGI